MYFLIGASLLFTFLLAAGIFLATLLTGLWHIAEPLLARLRPDT